VNDTRRTSGSPRSSARSGRLLVAAATALTVLGVVLLTANRPAPGGASADTSPVVSPPSRSTAAVPAPAVSVPARQVPSARQPSQSLSPPSLSPSATTPRVTGAPLSEALPPAGSGPAADGQVQRALDQAVPQDLSPALSRQLAALGRRVWLAEVTGAGRVAWPAYFSGRSADAVYSQVRVQAVIARQENLGARGAVVRLVWAGADPSGSYLEDRTATVHLTRQGDGSWEPVR
jgi:hypothetical protein